MWELWNWWTYKICEDNETSDQSEETMKIVTTEHSLISDPGCVNTHSSIVKVIQSDRCATESQKQKKGKIYNRESFSCAWWLQFRILFTLQHKEVISIHWDWDQSNSTDSQPTIGKNCQKCKRFKNKFFFSTCFLRKYLGSLIIVTGVDIKFSWKAH